MIGTSTASQARRAAHSWLTDLPYWAQATGGLVVLYALWWLLAAVLGRYSFISVVGLTELAGLLLAIWRADLFFGLLLPFVLTFRTVAYYIGLPIQTDVIAVGLGFLSVVSLLRARPWTRVGAAWPIALLGVAFTGDFLASAVLNHTRPAGLALSAGWHFFAFALLATLYLHPSVTLAGFRRWLYGAAVIIALQAPIQVFEFLVAPVSGLPRAYVNADFYPGSFGPAGTNVMGVLALAATYAALTYITLRGVSVWAVLLVASSFLACLIGDVAFMRLGALAYPVVGTVIGIAGGVFSGPGTAGRLLRLWIVIPILLVLLQVGGDRYITFTGLRPIRTQQMLSLDTFRFYLNFQYQQGVGRSLTPGPQTSPQPGSPAAAGPAGPLVIGRLKALQLSLQVWRHSTLRHKLFGYGPDSARISASHVLGVGGESAPFGIATFYGLDRFILELGVVGVLTYVGILAYLAWQGLLLLRRGRSPDHKLWGFIFLGSLAVFVATFNLDGGWFEPFGVVIMFWVGAAGLLRIVDVERVERAEPA